MNEQFSRKDRPVFRPRPEGCVGRDPRLAAELNEVLCYCIYTVAANTYRAMVCGKADSAIGEMLEMIAADGIGHFHVLGDLILALGGQPGVRANVFVEPISLPTEENGTARKYALRKALRSSREENRRATDLLQSLMGRTEDRVVRSILSGLLHDVGLHREMLERALG